MPGVVGRGSSAGAGGGAIASVCGGQADAPGRPGLLHLIVPDAAGANGACKKEVGEARGCTIVREP